MITKLFAVCLLVEDLAISSAKGVKIFEGPKSTSWGQTVAYLHDPDGHIIELTN